MAIATGAGVQGPAASDPDSAAAELRSSSSASAPTPPSASHVSGTAPVIEPNDTAGPAALIPSPSPLSAPPPPIRRFTKQLIPDSLLHDPALNQAISVLPSNYNFEVHKTVWRLQQLGAKRVALQFPEGLLMYACIISDILERFAGVEHTFILGDVTYGACCIDDYSAAALGAELLVHYGHSCLVPVDITSITCLYVFVDISIDVDHLVETVQRNFDPGCNIVLAGTIQFSSALQLSKQRLSPQFPSLTIPKCKPLSPGEVLGCTAPVISGTEVQAIIFVADGRFHLEAIMIANPSIPAFRYDPYARVMTQEHYDQQGMRAVRQRAIQKASSAQRWCLVLGTLGRQGNHHVLDMLQEHFTRRGMETTTLLMSEISPPRLDMLPDVQAFVQVACPRLSIDWGEGFSRPTLTPFEALVALGEVPPWWELPAPGPAAAAPEGHSGGPRAEGQGGEGEVVLGPRRERERRLPGLPVPEPAAAAAPYPMDYYAKEGGEWSSSWHKKPAQAQALAQARAAALAPEGAPSPAAVQV